MIPQSMIVKVQIPLAGDPQVFVYNEDRSVEVLWPYTKELRRDLRRHMGDRPKAYFDAYIKNKTLYLDRVVADQPW